MINVTILPTAVSTISRADDTFYTFESCAGGMFKVKEVRLCNIGAMDLFLKGRLYRTQEEAERVITIITQ